VTVRPSTSRRVLRHRDRVDLLRTGREDVLLRRLDGRPPEQLRLPVTATAPTSPTLGTTPARAGFTARLLAEAVGTGLLVAAVIGSGIAAQRLSPGDVGLQLLENAIATGAVLAVLIVVLQPVSAAFNPVVTLVERLTGAIATGDALGSIAAQLLGGAAGAVVANLMFGEPAVTVAATERTGPGLWLAEVVATAGLVLTIVGLTRSGRPQHIGWAVGAYITAAYWFTSSTGFANPAVTIARMLSDTFAGIMPSSVPAFLACQIVGGAVGYLTARTLYPKDRP
jgi:glycerol uptake facilitator-like aquaporin